MLQLYQPGSCFKMNFVLLTLKLSDKGTSLAKLLFLQLPKGEAVEAYFG